MSGSVVRSLHVVRDTDEVSVVRPRPKHLPITARSVSGPVPRREEIAIVFARMREARVQQGDRSCSVEALAIRGDLTLSLVSRMLRGEVRIGLDDAIAFGSIGVEILEWALAAARSRLVGGSR